MCAANLRGPHPTTQGEDLLSNQIYCSFSLLFFLKGLEQKLTEALHSILNDDKQGERVACGTAFTHISQRWAAKLVKYCHDDPSSAHSSEHDQLFYLVYERVQVVEGSLNPHLWAYRSRITLEHLRQNLQQQNMRKKCPILHAFLQKVCVWGGGGGGCMCACVRFPQAALRPFPDSCLAHLKHKYISLSTPPNTLYMQSCLSLSTRRSPT